jgi:hypothetical protein
MIIRTSERATWSVTARRRLRISIVTSAVAVFVLPAITGGVAGASPSSFPLKIATYALATATNDRPAHVVNAADVSNAFDTFNPSETNQFSLVFNLGEVKAFPRLVDLISSVTYKSTCIDFPDKIGARPTIAPCPLKAIAILNVEANVLIVARNAIAAAASHGKAVSGADVVAADVGPTLRMDPVPTFAAGQGGVVKFVTKQRINQTQVSLSLCLNLPKTPFGLPHLTAC